MKNLGRVTKRILIGASLITLVAGGAGIGGVAYLFHRAEPDYAGLVRLPGLTGRVDIWRDAHGIPHIFAPAMNDAARALGYVHASERFFQMETQRRAGQGRLSEIFGVDMLGVDQFTRTLGLYRLAQSSFAAMDPEGQSYFQAYADGVNAWLETHRDRLPPEFLLLNAKPEAWQPADSVVWGKLMALQLSHNYHLEILRAQLAEKIPAERLSWLFPMPPAGTPVTTQPTGTPEQTTRADEVLGRLIGLDHAASNEWVIGGARTQSGKPLLANDPHLGLEAPILWYLARLVTPQGSVKGATVPGLPIILLGENDHLAWGFTTTGSDVQDLFIETCDPKNADQYLTPKGIVPFETRKEIIHVKGEKDLVLTVRTTRHGPVLSDINTEMAALAGDGHVMALSFTGLGATDGSSESLLKINHAKDWKGFLAALATYEAPPQNMVFADRAGNIGYINPGHVPVRITGLGLLPADGAKGENDWRGFVPFTQLPQVYNPKVGFVFNANNQVAPASPFYFWGRDWEEPYRAKRLQYYFDTLQKHSLDSSARMQADHVSEAVKTLLPALLKAADTVDPDMAARLRAWDGTMDQTKPEPLLFNTWLWALNHIVLGANAEAFIKTKGPLNAASLAFILAHGAEAWCQGDCDKLVLQALTQARQRLGGTDWTKKQWGSEHKARLKNNFYSHFPLLDSFSDLSVPSDGDFYTLDRGGGFSPEADHPFTKTHGSGYRALYDLGQPDQSRFMITTGQSGHIFSAHYGDLVPLWKNAAYITLSGTEDELKAKGYPVMVLRPE